MYSKDSCICPLTPPPSFPPSSFVSLPSSYVWCSVKGARGSRERSRTSSTRRDLGGGQREAGDAAVATAAEGAGEEEDEAEAVVGMAGVGVAVGAEGGEGGEGDSSPCVSGA